MGTNLFRCAVRSSFVVAVLRPLAQRQFFFTVNDTAEAAPLCRPPSSPGSIFSAALCAIISTAICSTKNFFRPTRPFVAVSFGSSPIEALYDTGSDVSCVDESVFRSIPVQLRPPQCTSSPRQQYHSASGNQLIVRGIYPFKISLLGRTIEHKFCVIKNLSEKVIIGADFINSHALRYCPLSASTTWATPTTWDKGSARVASIQTLPPFTSKLVPVHLYTASQARPEPGSNLVVNVIAEHFPELSGGPALLQADVFGKSHLEICNLGPHPITLSTMIFPPVLDTSQISRKNGSRKCLDPIFGITNKVPNSISNSGTQWREDLELPDHRSNDNLFKLRLNSPIF